MEKEFIKFKQSPDKSWDYTTILGKKQSFELDLLYAELERVTNKHGTLCVVCSCKNDCFGCLYHENIFITK